MKLKLGQYAKRIKKSRYEVLRMILRGELRAEEIVEDGKKVYYIEIDERVGEFEKPRPDLVECDELRLIFEGNRLIVYRDGSRMVYERVEGE